MLLQIIVLEGLFFHVDVFRSEKSDFKYRKREAKDIHFFPDEDE